MIQLLNEADIYVYTPAVDMRKSINGLSVLVEDELEQSPQSGSLYLFHNKAKDKVKILYWDKNGFIMHYKRLEKGRFKFPKNYQQDSFDITQDQLGWLLAGLDFMLMDTFSELNYSYYS